MSRKNTNKYKAEDLVVLEGLEAVRLRPGMYIGTTGIKGLHHILWEIVDNAMDEAANGYADTIKVCLKKDGSVSVEDNGRGIPVDIHPKHKISGVELVYTRLHAGGKFDNKEYKFSGGLHGVGASVTNALSKWLKVEVYKNNNLYIQEFHSYSDEKGTHSGVPKGPIKNTGKAKGRGTRVTFLPDDEVFESIYFDRKTIRTRLKELAYLNKGVKMILIDEREQDEDGENYKYEFLFKGGLVNFINDITESKQRRSDKVIYFEEKQENFELEIAIQYAVEYTETIISYVNNIPTSEGGTHETGFKQAFTKCMNNYVQKNNLVRNKNVNIIGDDYREGINVVISIRMQNIQFEGQTKNKLGNPEVKGIVESIVTEQFNAYLNENKNKDMARMIAKIGIDAEEVRRAEKHIKKVMREKNANTGKILAGKLSSSTGRRPEKNEIFIVEGDSAGGTAKQARNKSFQAVLPLKGKSINVEKRRKSEVIGNDEIQTLIFALGCDIDKDFDINKLKYHKIIILSDADHDGEHIRSLLLTFFYRYMRPLITNGHIYVGVPPLYKLTKKKETLYAYNDRELDKILANDATRGKYVIQRYKGLGEMNPSQLWETTLNPETRTMMKITVEDAAEAERMISILMGSDSVARKDFINENAEFNKEDSFRSKYGGEN
ncbi:MAG TPA: DNA gyrase subunit B [Clostridiales bacterium]|nr:DNA gyrase subunit B [Clostridiales bacterium]